MADKIAGIDVHKKVLMVVVLRRIMSAELIPIRVNPVEKVEARLKSPKYDAEGI